MGRERHASCSPRRCRRPVCGWCRRTAASRLNSPPRRPDEAQHGYPQLLAGGSQVLFSVRRENAWHLALLALTDRDWRLLGNGRVIGEGAQYLPTGHLVYAQSGGLVATPFDPSSGRSGSAAGPAARARRDIAVRRRLLCVRGRSGNARLCAGAARRWRIERCCASIVTAVSHRSSRRAPATSIRRFLRTDGSVAVMIASETRQRHLDHRPGARARAFASRPEGPARFPSGGRMARGSRFSRPLPDHGTCSGSRSTGAPRRSRS